MILNDKDMVYVKQMTYDKERMLYCCLHEKENDLIIFMYF